MIDCHGQTIGHLKSGDASTLLNLWRVLSLFHYINMPRDSPKKIRDWEDGLNQLILWVIKHTFQMPRLHLYVDLFGKNCTIAISSLRTATRDEAPTSESILPKSSHCGRLPLYCRDFVGHNQHTSLGQSRKCKSNSTHRRRDRQIHCPARQLKIWPERREHETAGAPACTGQAICTPALSARKSSITSHGQLFAGCMAAMNPVGAGC